MYAYAPCGAGRISSSQLTGSAPARSERRWAWLRAPRVPLGCPAAGRGVVVWVGRRGRRGPYSFPILGPWNLG